MDSYRELPCIYLEWKYNSKQAMFCNASTIVTDTMGELDKLTLNSVQFWVLVTYKTLDPQRLSVLSVLNTMKTRQKPDNSLFQIMSLD